VSARGLGFGRCVPSQWEEPFGMAMIEAMRCTFCLSSGAGGTVAGLPEGWQLDGLATTG
jgi:hypothetical protein